MAPILVLGAEIDAPTASSAEALRPVPDVDRSEASQLAKVQLTDTHTAPKNLLPQESIPEALTLPAALLIPVAGVTSSELQDTFSEGRSSGRIHDAIDIMARKGTPIFAVADGTIAHLCKRGRGGLSIYQFDAKKNFVYFYAHLNAYSPSLVVGKKIKQGEIIGYVGHTGNARASAPHLHFAMASVATPNQWWGGDSINPYPLFQR
ncbi:M23 family metallopeptidase [Stenotrophobium rhamnosiphilum]|nr:M23 family metallopeptidase [Stenotrophobium rhamnosiphilum]